jgi:hypothetical protein
VLALLAALAVVLGPTAPAQAQTANPVTPDNRPSTVAGETNGALPSHLLGHVTPSCRTFGTAAPSLISMMVAAAADGVTLIPSDCYRDYAGQVAARDYWCQQGACHMAAVPGTSNHGWGKAVDFRDQNGSFNWTSRGYLWMKANAWRYGWNHAAVFWPTGSVPEPWHWEWVGDGGRLYPGIGYGIGEGLGLPGSGNPAGALDAATANPGATSIRVSGWAADGNTTASIDVHVYVSGRFGGAARANQPRADVARAIHGYAASPHGYGFDIPVLAGTHLVCAFGINVGAGTNVPIGCSTVKVGGNPFGSFDALRTDGPTPTVSGWALDPDQLGPIDVHAYVNGRLAGVGGGGGYRPDVGSLWPMHGDSLGYSVPVQLDQGANLVCVFGINVGAGTNVPIGCRTATVDRNPFGSVDAVGPGFGGLIVAGWAIDPDTTAPIQTHVWVNGTRHVLDADWSRPDVGAAFAPYGDRHGYFAVLPLPPGRSTVCTYAINHSTGNANILLGGGCRTITA